MDPIPPRYAVYTPYSSASVHRVLLNEKGYEQDRALCGFNARLGWFAAGDSPARLGHLRMNLCARCESKARTLLGVPRRRAPATLA